MASPTPQPLVLSGIDKTWHGSDEHVLRDVALTLEPGAATWLGGRNGAGKTTLLRVAAGLIRPDTGTVRLGTIDAERDKTGFRRRIGFLSAGSSSLYARLTVADHLDFWAGVAMLPAARRRPAAARITAALQLGALMDKRVDRLSMGQRQRARLAGILLHDPDVVLLDEPANSLDEEAIGLLVEQVGVARARGATVLWCAPSGEQEPLPFDHRLRLADGVLAPA